MYFNSVPLGDTIKIQGFKMAYHNPGIKGSSFKTKAEAIKKEEVKTEPVKAAQPVKPVTQPITKDK